MYALVPSGPFVATCIASKCIHTTLLLQYAFRATRCVHRVPPQVRNTKSSRLIHVHNMIFRKRFDWHHLEISAFRSRARGASDARGAPRTHARPRTASCAPASDLYRRSADTASRNDGVAARAVPSPRPSTSFNYPRAWSFLYIFFLEAGSRKRAWRPSLAALAAADAPRAKLCGRRQRWVCLLRRCRHLRRGAWRCARRRTTRHQ